MGFLGLDVGHVGMGVPDLQGAHVRVAAHLLAVGRAGGPDDAGPDLLGEAVPAPRDGEACRQPFDVPLPRAGQGLVEVVDVEHQMALGGGQQTEVQQMGVPAQLGAQPRRRCRGQVRGHEGGGAAVEAERGFQHPSVAQGHQLRYTERGLPFDDVHRVGPAGRGGELRMTRAGHFGAKCPACFRALLRGGSGGHDRDRRGCSAHRAVAVRWWLSVHSAQMMKMSMAISTMAQKG